MADAKRAVIGLDGLDPLDLNDYTVPGEWSPVDIETVAHTCPSWNGIFSGQELDEVYGFHRLPDDYEPGRRLAQNGGSRWTYEELLEKCNGQYVWELIDVDVVSAPVVLPTYSTHWEDGGQEYGWPATGEEIGAAIDALTDAALEYDDCIVVYPLPDKCNHLFDSDEKDYTDIDRRRHMHRLMHALDDLTSHFDEWIMCSDHGRPDEAEYPIEGVSVASHRKSGLVRSNVVDVQALDTNLDVYDVIMELFTES